MKKPKVISLHFMMDSDGESMGILETDLDTDVLTKEWQDYYNGEHFELDVDVEIFATKMQEKFKENTFSRVFAENIYL